MKVKDPMEEISSQQCFRRENAVDISELPDGYMVTDTKRGRVHYLNSVAAIVFELCDGTQPAGKMVELLKREFSLASAPEDQVVSCLATLMKEGLVVPCPS